LVEQVARSSRVVFIPVSDENALKSIRFQWVTLVLIMINVAVFAATIAGIPEEVLLSFAIVPRELFDEDFRGAATYPHKFNHIDVREIWTPLTYMFMHGNIMHLIGNMLFLWVFGDNVEDAMGHVRFLVFYIVCGITGALFHAALLPSSEIPLIGASGAVAGVITAYLILYPRVQVWILVFRFLPLKLPVFLVLGSWILLQFAMPFLGGGGQISWYAHVGGIIAGAALVFPLKRSGVRAFQGIGGS
jgi:membrane associated rhomboid family serine protease